jgi:hypothetical protein
MLLISASSNQKQQTDIVPDFWLTEKPSYRRTHRRFLTPILLSTPNFGMQIWGIYTPKKKHFYLTYSNNVRHVWLVWPFCWAYPCCWYSWRFTAERGSTYKEIGLIPLMKSIEKINNTVYILGFELKLHLYWKLDYWFL